MVWGLPRCDWARESTAPAQGNQSLSRELRASALCPGLDIQKDLGSEPHGGSLVSNMQSRFEIIKGSPATVTYLNNIGTGGRLKATRIGPKEAQ